MFIHLPVCGFNDVNTMSIKDETKTSLGNDVHNVLISLSNETFGEILFEIEGIFHAHLLAIHFERGLRNTRLSPYRDHVFAEAEVERVESEQFEPQRADRVLVRAFPFRCVHLYLL